MVKIWEKDLQKTWLKRPLFIYNENKGTQIEKKKTTTLSIKHCKSDGSLSKPFLKKMAEMPSDHIQQLERQDGRRGWDMEERQKLWSWIEF